MSQSNKLTIKASEGNKFHSTQKWNTLIKIMYENVEQKSKKTTNKKYVSCFCGSNAIDVLHSYVSKNHAVFQFSPNITRHSILKLCQFFVDKSFIAPIEQDSYLTISRKKPSQNYEDSSSSYYEFTTRTKELIACAGDNAVFNSLNTPPSLKRKKTLDSSANKYGKLPKRVFSFRKSMYECENSTSTLQRKSYQGRNEISLLRATPRCDPVTSSHAPQSENKKSSNSFIRNSLSRKSWSKAVKNVKRLVTNPSELVSMGTRRQSAGLLRWKPQEDLSGCDKEIDEIMSERNNNTTPIKFCSERKITASHSASKQQSLTPKPRVLLKGEINSSGRKFLAPSLRRSLRLRSKRNDEPKRDANGNICFGKQEYLKLRRQCVRVKLLQMIDLEFVDNLIESPSRIDYKSLISDYTRATTSKNFLSTLEENNIRNDQFLLCCFKVARIFTTEVEIRSKLIAVQHNMTLKKQLLNWVKTGLKKQFKNDSLIHFCTKEALDEVILMIDQRPKDVTFKVFQLVILLLDNERIQILSDLIKMLFYYQKNHHKDTISKSSLEFVTDDILSVIFPLGTNCVKNYKIRGSKVSEYFLRTRLLAIVQLMIEYQASIFDVPQELAAAIERKKSCIQNGQEFNLNSISYAQRVSLKRYEKQKEDFTRLHLDKLKEIMNKNPELKTKLKSKPPIYQNKKN